MADTSYKDGATGHVQGTGVGGIPESAEDLQQRLVEAVTLQGLQGSVGARCDDLAPFEAMVHLTNKIGKLSGGLVKRLDKNPDFDNDKFAKFVGDAAILLVHLANITGVDFAKAVVTEFNARSARTNSAITLG